MHESLREGAAVRVASCLPDDFNGAAKSGTNYDFADAALFAYTSSFTCGVWIGFLNERRAIYPQAFASDVCGPVTGRVMQQARGSYEDKPIEPSSDTEAVEICRYSGQQATNFCYETVVRDGKPSYVRPTYVEYFPKGDVTLSACTVHGDGSPSLSDLLDTRGNNMFSRVLPIAPILPKGLALQGEDPYGCQQTLCPKYKEDTAVAGGIVGSQEEEALPADDTDEEEDSSFVNSEIQLRMPLPLRKMPRPLLKL